MRGCRNLFEQATGFHALRVAALEASRRKRDREAVSSFLFNLEHEVLALQRELRQGVYRPAPYRTFLVRDPKQRMICAAAFRDRVVHHVVCRVLEPVLERTFIHDSYACRREKGTHLAVRRAQTFCRRHPYYLKLDICEYFDSIDHRTLKGMLAGLIRDPDLLRLASTSRTLIRSSAAGFHRGTVQGHEIQAENTPQGRARASGLFGGAW